MLLEEFLKPARISQRKFAQDVGVTTVALSEIIKGKRGITVNTALRFSMALGTTPELWLKLQRSYDLATAPAIDMEIPGLDLGVTHS